MSVVSDIEIRLRADIARLQQDMNAARSAVSGAMSDIEKAVNAAKTAMAAFAAALALKAIADFANETIEAAGSLNDMAIQTGASVAALMKFKSVAATTETSIDGVAGMLNKLAKNLAVSNEESKGVGGAVAALGLDFDTLRKMAPDQQLLTIAKALDKFQNGGGKSAAAMTLLGKEAAKSLPFLTDLAGAADDISAALTEQEIAAKAALAGMADDFGDNMTKIQIAADQWKKEIVYATLPAMVELSQAFLDVGNSSTGLKGEVTKLAADGSITDWARKAVVGLTYLIDALQILGRVADLIMTAVGSQFAIAATGIGGSIKAIKQAVSGDFRDAFNTLKQVSSTTGSILDNLGESFDKAVGDQTFGAKIRDRIEALQQVKAEAKDAKPAVDFKDNSEADAAAKKAAADAAAAAKKEQDTYLGLITTIREKIEADKAELAAGQALTDAQKASIKLDQEIATGKTVLTGAHLAAVRAAMVDAAAQDALVKAQVDLLAATKALADEKEKGLESLAAEALANQQAVANFGLTKAAIEANTVARLQEKLARESSTDISTEANEQLMREIALRKENAAALSQMADLEGAKKGADDLKDFLDPAKAQSFGDALSDAFGAAGSSLSKLTKAFTTYASKQADFEKQRGNAANKYLNGLSTEKEYQEDLGAVQQKQTAAQLGGYGDMAGAAAGFFGEQSKGYKTLMAVSEVFHAAELAMTIAELVPKAISAILTQASGDPYTAFARMAAMAAVVAGLGVAVSGGGGAKPPSSADLQKANGTGTVLGDSDAKSQSLVNALKMVQDNTYRSLSVNQDMLVSLRAIQSSLSGLGNLITRTTGITGDLAADQNGSAQNLFNSILGNQSIGEKLTGGLLGKIVGGIFGGKVTTLDTGLTAAATTVGNAANGGVNAGQYTDTKKSGGLFSSDKYKTSITALGSEINDQFALVITSMADGIKASASALGVGGDAFNAQLNSFVVDLGKISLKGLTGDQIQEALEAAFSKLGDDMAKFAVGGLAQFQKVGEGAYETLVRIANDYSTVDAVLSSFGKSFGAVGLASVAARENLIDLAGGLEDFTSQGSYFLDNFFSDAEKAATLKTAVNARITPLNGGADVTTIEQYKNLAMAQDLTTESGRAAYTTLMQTAEAFKQLVDYGNAAGKTIEDIANERSDLQDQIDTLTKTSLQLRAKERATLDASNQVLYDQLQALNDLAAARTAETDRLNAVAISTKAFAASLNTALDSLKQGTLSTLTPIQKLADAQSKYQQTLVSAKAGDATAQGALAAAAQAYLTADQVVNASSSRYAADAAKVQAELAALAAQAVGQASDAEQQLAVLTAQANTLLAVNDSVNAASTSIVAAIEALNSTGYIDGSHKMGLTSVPFDGYVAQLHAGEGVLTAQQNKAYLSGQSGGSDSGTAAAVAALTKEVAALRADAAQHAGYIANTVANSSAASADKITQGSKDAAMATVYADRLAPALV